MTLAVLANGLALTGGVAAADSGTGYPPPDLFNLSSLELPATLPSSGDYYAGGIYSATSAQITSLQDLEQEAIANTISDHALAATDTEAVDSWPGRTPTPNCGRCWCKLSRPRRLVPLIPTSRTRPAG